MGPMDALNAAKEIGEAIKKFNDIPLYEKIVALQGQLVEIATERMNLFQENQALKEKLARRTSIKFKAPYYYQDDDAVPFCPKCYESSKFELLVHLPSPRMTKRALPCGNATPADTHFGNRSLGITFSGDSAGSQAHIQESRSFRA